MKEKENEIGFSKVFENKVINTATAYGLIKFVVNEKKLSNDEKIESIKKLIKDADKKGVL